MPPMDRVRLCVLFLFLLVADGVIARADVAPPPPPTLPEIPGTQISLPSAVLIVVAGILLSVGVVWIGRLLARQKNKPSATTVAACAAVGLAGATIVGAVYAHHAHDDYRQRRRIHREELRRWPGRTIDPRELHPRSEEAGSVQPVTNPSNDHIVPEDP